MLLSLSPSLAFRPSLRHLTSSSKYCALTSIASLDESGVVNSWIDSSVITQSINEPNEVQDKKTGIAEFSDLIQNFSSSPVEKLIIRDSLLVYIKRDDLLRLRGPGISGNKARKMLSLITSSLQSNSNPNPNSSSPDTTPTPPINSLVSHGGHQSNAMLSLSACSNYLSIPFTYYCKKLPRWLKNNPSGNYLRSKSLGMQVIQLSNEEYNNKFSITPTNIPPFDPPTSKALWVPQGGASNLAVQGCERLAGEIYDFYVSHFREGSGVGVVIPCGTGCTALLVHREINRLMENYTGTGTLKVIGVGVCGGRKGITAQMKLLSKETGHEGESLPEIIDCKIPFAKPVQNVVDVFQVR
ncbi:hypothetical protein TL16_g05133 [Triparma laevis f. inornata]|uniref:Uncharacterized protein n=2 Tax=Triparma laevis TaxID=1534972 RepID=A0A9W7FUV8_9STRA|nr:hypothetical protein TL16_g05133 [Triparma laevis f. inornata]GMI18368.1 hypothetical protein TrLO_g7910 [Triparma laevis f. longispina]